jgi:tungstate transport system permease protein
MLRQAVQRIADGDPALVAVTTRTLRLALLSTSIALAIGLPLGYLISSGRSRLRRIGLVFANAGLGLPPVVIGVYFALLLIPGSLLGQLHLTYTLTAIVIVQAILALPVVVALTASAVAGLSGGLLDQARALGASGTQLAVLALREARVGVMAAVIVAFGCALAEVGAVVIVGGNIPMQTDTLASSVLNRLSAGDPAGATANILVLLALMLALAALLSLIQQYDGRWSASVRRLRDRQTTSETISA